MIETQMSVDRFVCRVTWTVVLGLLVGAWVVALRDGDDWLIAGLMAATGCATSAVAATLQIRQYVVRTCTLVRALGGAAELERPTLHRVP